jgi:hypothetical protein
VAELEALTPARRSMVPQVKAGVPNTEVETNLIIDHNICFITSFLNIGVSSDSQCDELPSNLQAGCHWRWEWYVCLYLTCNPILNIMHFFFLGPVEASTNGKII